MNGQNEREFQKNEDDDFDFFKKPKNVNLQKNENVNAIQLEKMASSNNTNEKKLYKSFLSKSQTKSIIFSLSVIVFFIGLITINLNKSKQVYIVPNNKVVNQIVEEKPINDLKEPFNVDYSKLNKDDAERVKKVLNQFKDIQKTLIEQNTTNSKK
jgi:hypothetical protein